MDHTKKYNTMIRLRLSKGKKITFWNLHPFILKSELKCQEKSSRYLYVLQVSAVHSLAFLDAAFLVVNNTFTSFIVMN